MKADHVDIVAAPSVRRSLTIRGDIRSDIEFQNDVNRLLARFEESVAPWRSAAQLVSYQVGPQPSGYVRRNSVTKPFQVFDGGSVTLPAGPIPYSIARSSTSAAPTRTSSEITVEVQFRRGA